MNCQKLDIGQSNSENLLETRLSGGIPFIGLTSRKSNSQCEDLSKIPLQIFVKYAWSSLGNKGLLSREKTLLDSSQLREVHFSYSSHLFLIGNKKSKKNTCESPSLGTETTKRLRLSYKIRECYSSSISYYHRKSTPV